MVPDWLSPMIEVDTKSSISFFVQPLLSRILAYSGGRMTKLYELDSPETCWIIALNIPLSLVPFEPLIWKEFPDATVTVLSSFLKPCSTCSGSHGLSSSFSAKVKAYFHGLPITPISSIPFRIPPIFFTISCIARPMAAFAISPGPRAPELLLTRRSLRMGPFMIQNGAGDNVLPSCHGPIWEFGPWEACTPAINTGI